MHCETQFFIVAQVCIAHGPTSPNLVSLVLDTQLEPKI
jgi:hypothetical protein